MPGARTHTHIHTHMHTCPPSPPRRDLGLQPHLLGEAIVDSLLEFAIEVGGRYGTLNPREP